MSDELRYDDLCELRKGERLLVVSRADQGVYVVAKGKNCVEATDHAKLLDLSGAPWSLLSPGAPEPAQIPGWLGHVVPRAMRIGLTKKQLKDSTSFNRVWCPARELRAGWAWVNAGKADQGRGNDGMILHVSTGMAAWYGPQKAGMSVLKMLAMKFPYAFKDTAFGTQADASSPEYLVLKECLRWR